MLKHILKPKAKKDFQRSRATLSYYYFLRDKMAHFPAPSIAECLAGAMAANDLLASHSIHAPGSLQTCMDLLRALMPHGDHNQQPLDVELPKRQVLFAVANQALD